VCVPVLVFVVVARFVRPDRQQRVEMRAVVMVLVRPRTVPVGECPVHATSVDWPTAISWCGCRVDSPSVS